MRFEVNFLSKANMSETGKIDRRLIEEAAKSSIKAERAKVFYKTVNSTHPDATRYNYKVERKNNDGSDFVEFSLVSGGY